MLELVKAGADVFRINFSHADYELVKKKCRYHQRNQSRIWFQYYYSRRPARPKLRVGVVKDGSYLNPGDVLTFTNENAKEILPKFI